MGDNYSDIPMEIDDTIDSDDIIDDTIDSDDIENSNLVEDNQNFGIQDAEHSASSNNFITMSPIKNCLSETIIIHDKNSNNLQNTSIMLNEQSLEPNLYETIIHVETSINPLNKAIILNEQSFETSNNLEIYEGDKFKNKKVNETYVENDSSLLVPIIQITPSTPKKNLVDSDIKIATNQICGEVTDSCINPEVHSYVPESNNSDVNSTNTRPNTKEIANDEICCDLLDSFVMPPVSPSCMTDDSDLVLDFETGEVANVQNCVKTPEKATKSQETEDIKSESTVCNIEEIYEIKNSLESTEAAAEMKSESHLSNIEELSEIKESPEPQETTAEVKSESPLSNVEKLSKVKDLNALVPSETKSDKEVVEENIEIIEISCDEIIETADYKKSDSQEKLNVLNEAKSEMDDSSSSGGSRNFPDLDTFLKGKIPENQQDESIAPLSKLNNPIMHVKEDQLNPMTFDLSVFSDSPARSSNRGSVFKLFDPLYKSDENKDCPKVKEPSQEETEEENKDCPKAKEPSQEQTEENMVLDELNTLKLEVNQLHQEKAALELECLQKDEVILKAQAEFLKKEITYNEDIKALEDKLNSMNEQHNNNETKVLTEEIEDTKNSKIHLTEKIILQDKEIAELRNTQNQYIEIFKRMVAEGNEYKFECRSTQQHLTNIEMAFSDVHSKYERTKEILKGYKSNEEVLMTKLDTAIDYAKKYEERYNSLKAHAKVQLDKANKELFSMKERQHSELSKLTSLIRRLEIKNGSIQQSLDQKTKECADLAALCDELTGSVSR